LRKIINWGIPVVEQSSLQGKKLDSRHALSGKTPLIFSKGLNLTVALG